MKNFSVEEFFEDKSFDDYKRPKWIIDVESTRAYNIFETNPDWLRTAAEALAAEIDRDIVRELLALSENRER